MRKTAVISIMFITILVLSAVFIVPAIFAIVDEKNAKEHLAFTVVECEVHPIIGDYNHWPSDEDKQNFMDMAGMEEEDYAHFVDNTASYSSATITCSIENNYSKDCLLYTSRCV